MFEVNAADVEDILNDYGIFSKVSYISEMQRYDYGQNAKGIGEVRLIIKVECKSAAPLVIRFKNEKNVTLEIIESQCRFAEILKKGGIITPHQYQTEGIFAKWYNINGYDVIVTVEQFVEGEIKAVDEKIAEKTGKLLAKMHTISETNNIHVQNAVLFNPFKENDLFDYVSFKSIETGLTSDVKSLFDRIADKYNAYMEILSPLKRQQKYAVQGDISECNLYQTCSGKIGVFDFNRCGDNNLFCDAVMQAVFYARLMDYPENAKDDIENKILAAFWKGYRSIRHFSEEQTKWYPYLYAIINAFWSEDIRWNDDSLIKAYNSRDTDNVQKWLCRIWERLISLHCLPI